MIHMNNVTKVYPNGSTGVEKMCIRDRCGAGQEGICDLLRQYVLLDLHKGRRALHQPARSLEGRRDGKPEL